MIRIKRLKRKLRLRRWAIASLTIVVALASVGITYAAISGTGTVEGTLFASNVVPVTDCSDPFTWVASNDDGKLDYYEPYSTTVPIDPGDDGTPSVYDRWGSESSADPYTPQTVPSPPSPPFPVDPADRYTKDVAKTKATLIDDYNIEVIVTNGYPYYYSTVFFALNCPGGAEGHITSIDLDLSGVPAGALTVTHSGIYIGQFIPDGDEVVGALHVRIEQQEWNQGKTYKFTFSITTECAPANCGTAYAYGGSYATCFFDIKCLKNPPWGWSNGLLPPKPLNESYTFPLYAGAANCDIDKGRLVGTVEIKYTKYYSNGTYDVTVTYDMILGNYMTSTHLYIGSDIVPTFGKQNKCTVSPGKYGNTHSGLDYETSDKFTVKRLSGDIYVIAHAVACWFR